MPLPILVAVAALLAYLWFSALAARERAVRAATETCRHREIQLLDDTVVLRRVHLCRGDRALVQLRRTYEFEYSEHGGDRQRGFVILCGARVETVGLGPPSAPG
ncbi:MAG: DUF3301 domain-containing protein [Gammaproteobacteria bacterium]|nr:DUF3301 domain-containing protein [Gammaproteobacteria bacterium]NIR97338.1 DUF3301 domain-containing protein [Gammaproteobacteria bacterium]NIT63381.1 DUF3301 domain-containing protein [Gammaproteobacteria bacterium]NIV20308.1 DUF3301 domain-containing protein [Gammaproteobacteria bacterium]NIX10725.1 DUF3301 domain-containing protein [Gammaproteobacteria bacterium]